MEVIGPIQVRRENRRAVALFMKVFSLDGEMLTEEALISLLIWIYR